MKTIKQPSVQQLVEAAKRNLKPSRRCPLCEGHPATHPWAKVITEALKKGASPRGLERALQEEGVKDVKFSTIRSHKALHLQGS
jgi:methylphosphotriester-DNA--protein-cysteine methyltransferase